MLQINIKYLFVACRAKLFPNTKFLFDDSVVDGPRKWFEITSVGRCYNKILGKGVKCSKINPSGYQAKCFIFQHPNALVGKLIKFPSLKIIISLLIYNKFFTNKLAKTHC